MNVSAPQVRPAATAVIFRDRSDGPPDLLMVERSRGMVFAAGACVFPGGAIDAADLAHAERLATGLPVDEAAARIGAIRETLEETGLGIGFRGPPEGALLARMRAAMAQGADFAPLLEQAGLALDLDALVPFARWEPARREGATRIFDTRFYLARHAGDDDELTVDATENVHLFWTGAAAMLDRCDRGEGRVIFPTRRNLERLALFASFDAAAAHARATPLRKVVPWVEERDGESHLCIPGDLGYPVTSEEMSRVMRG